MSVIWKNIEMREGTKSICLTKYTVKCMTKYKQYHWGEDHKGRTKPEKCCIRKPTHKNQVTQLKIAPLLNREYSGCTLGQGYYRVS